MKRLLPIFIGLLSCLCMTATPSVTIIDTDSVINVQLIDKVAASKGLCIIKVDYPICSNDRLAHRLLEHIACELDSFCPADHAPYQLKDYSVEALDTLIGTCAWQTIPSLDEEVESWEESSSEGELPICGIRSLTLKFLTDMPKCVSYLTCYEEFSGGVHGMYYYWPCTIRKSDGKRLTNILKENLEEKMQEVLWNCLLNNAEEDNKAGYREAFESYLDYAYGNKKHLPLPEAEPWIGHDGLHLQYQPYEIGTWAMGSVEILIPTEQALPFVSDEAASLMK